jgi:hypothetical protein
MTTVMVFKGREFEASEIELIEEVVEGYPKLSRQELANTVCELLEWRRPNGGLKTWEATDLLICLEQAGRLRLPALRSGRPRGSRTSVPCTVRGEPGEPLSGCVTDVRPVHLRRVRTADERSLWRELIGRHHYLGHTVPFGAHVRYLIEVARPSATVVGCVQLSSPAWKMAVRDRWIGWSDTQRRTHLQRVVQNSRFLILPWVEVRHLASHVLAQVARVVRVDWPESYGLEPVLLETLVDERRFSGTCYRAANWTALGTTQGRGRMDRENRRAGHAPKRVFVYPLVRDARAILRGER